MITFNAHIKIDSVGLDVRDFANARLYEADTQRVLNILVHTRTGSAVTQAIAMGKKNLIIRPYSAADRASARFNAYATEKNPDTSTIKGGHWQDTAGGRHRGLGGGSDSFIHFSSSTWAAFEKQRRGHHSGASPDEVLLHEMVHALRMLIGMSESVALGHLYDDEEEFFAILIANIYVSELNRRDDLRSDHHGFRRLSENQDTSEEFLPKADTNDYRYRLVRKLVMQEPFLCMNLANVPGTFNPIRRYFDLQTSAVQRQQSSQPSGTTPPTTPAKPKLKPTPIYDFLPDANGHGTMLARGLFGKFGPDNRLGFFA